jgi:tRNA(fMet)-specific endonuclease VapC
MTILDTDILSLLIAGHPRVSERFDREVDDVVTTVVSRIEILEGRLASVIKAADGQQLLQAQHWLQQSERDLDKYVILPFDVASADEFERLRANKKLKKIGRGDLLIASIALARRATLSTRNIRDFRLVPGLRVENWAD